MLGGRARKAAPAARSAPEPADAARPLAAAEAATGAAAAAAGATAAGPAPTHSPAAPHSPGGSADDLVELSDEEDGRAPGGAAAGAPAPGSGAGAPVSGPSDAFKGAESHPPGARGPPCGPSANPVQIPVFREDEGLAAPAATAAPADLGRDSGAPATAAPQRRSVLAMMRDVPLGNPWARPSRRAHRRMHGWWGAAGVQGVGECAAAAVRVVLQGVRTVTRAGRGGVQPREASSLSPAAGWGASVRGRGAPACLLRRSAHAEPVGPCLWKPCMSGPGRACPDACMPSACSAGTLTVNPVSQDLGDGGAPQEAPCAPAGGSMGHPAAAPGCARQGVPGSGGGSGASDGGAPPCAPCGSGTAHPPTACAGLGLSLRLDSETQPGFGLDSAPADEARGPQQRPPAPTLSTAALELDATPYALLNHGRQL